MAISSLGVGSGLDLSGIVSGLVDAQRAPTENRLALKEQDLTTELSAFGVLKSSLSLFQGSLSDLQSSQAFDVMKTTVSDESVFSASAKSTASPGSYSIEVTAIAQAQSLATNAATPFVDVNDTIGTGTLTIQFGTTATGPYSFTPDTSKATQTITVSAANNNTTLSGLRDYINDNDFGMQASIVNDGNGYRLLLTSESSGVKNSMEITVTSDGDGNDNDNAGLSQLAFNASAQSSVTQTVAAQDAALSINGLDITRETNTVADAISGVTLNLLTADIGNRVTLNIKQDINQAESSIKEFVESYNSLVTNLNTFTAYDAETGSAGILIGDFTVRSISSQLRNVLSAAGSQLSGSIRSLADIGITTDAFNGTLNLDNSKLDEALNNSLDEVEALFAQQGGTTDAGVEYISSTSDTKPGDYAINLTSVLTQGVLTGTDPVTDLTVQNNNNNMTLLIDGLSTGNITLTSGTYANEAALASEIQTQINAASTLVTNNVTVTVSYDVPSNRFVITSDTPGSASTVEITAIDPRTNADFGFSVGNGVDGTDLVGTINGLSATTNGKFLTSESGDSKGLVVEILSGGTGFRGTVSVSRGLADTVDEVLNNFLGSNGLIASREDGLNDKLEDIAEQREDLDTRIASLEARLIQQFTALDTLIAQFNSTSSFLSVQLANLPKPNSIGNNNS
jgi:flagellar hook-associated protein 2